MNPPETAAKREAKKVNIAAKPRKPAATQPRIAEEAHAEWARIARQITLVMTFPAATSPGSLASGGRIRRAPVPRRGVSLRRGCDRW